MKRVAYILLTLLPLFVGVSSASAATQDISQPVIIVPGILGSWQKNGQWVLDPLLHTFDNMVDTFKANGYVEGKTLFPFPYNWENSNTTTAKLLAQKIQDVKSICGCSKVDIVAHSMGGLATTAYLESVDYTYDVDQVIYIATPFTGAPMVYKAWEGGEVEFGNVVRNIIMQRIFSNEARSNGYKNIFDFIHGKPVGSIQELLPVYTDYLTQHGNTIPYPIGYPKNPFLENLLQKFSKVFATSTIQARVILADDLKNQTTQGYEIASSTQLPLWPDGQPDFTDITPGDGTVPRSSIENFIVPDKEFDGIDHVGVVSSSTAYVFKELTGKDPAPLINKSYGFFSGAGWKILFVKLFSPIDMEIIAPDGKRLGKDLATNAEVDEIPDAFYSGFNTDDEYAIILNPLAGTYTIKTVGTGSGPYTIAANLDGEAASSEADQTGTTTAGQIGSYILNVSSTSSPVTLVDNTLPPPPPPANLTPDTCLTDMTQAYQNGWFKKPVYEGLTADCKLLKVLFQARDKQKWLLRNATLVAMRLVLDHMDLLAKEKTNTKDGVDLIYKYTTWFRNHQL